MIYELREYHVKKGRMAQWVKLMETEIMPFQVSRGMAIPALFTAAKRKDLFIWLRRFRNEAERARQYRAVYEDAHWKKVLLPKIEQLLRMKEIVVTDLEPTARSVLQ